MCSTSSLRYSKHIRRSFPASLPQSCLPPAVQLNVHWWILSYLSIWCLYNRDYSTSGSGSAERTSGKSRPSALEKTAERLAEPTKTDEVPRREHRKTDEVPRREHRKRTRQNTQSPASSSDSPVTSKRARRI